MICICLVIVIKSIIDMESAHYTNLQPNFYHLYVFIVIVINTSNYLNIQYHRYEPETFSYTKQIESRYFLYGAII